MPAPIQLQYLPTRSLPDSPLRRTAATALLLAALVTALLGLYQSAQTALAAWTVIPKLRYLGLLFQLQLLAFDLIFCVPPLLVAAVQFICIRKIRRSSITALVTALILVAFETLIAASIFLPNLVDLLLDFPRGFTTRQSLTTTLLAFATLLVFSFALLVLSRLLHSTRPPNLRQP